MSEERMKIHIVGAGGAGMSAIAKVLVGIGHRVSGSDLRRGSALDRLADSGVDVYTGHRPDRAAAADLVVVSSAVPEGDIELQAAREAGVPVWGRPQMLEALSKRFPTIGATGTHGKTTTTSLLIAGLRAAGSDPSFIVGGELADLKTNGHFGRDDLLVIEADEAFRTFEKLHLKGLVVTNVETEHVEHYGSLEELVASFVSVATAVDGPVLVCADDEGASRVAAQIRSSTYGTSASADWRMERLESTGASSRFLLSGPQVEQEVMVSRPGAHVARNAAGALALLAEMGYDLVEAAKGVAGFQGVGRRWEHRGTVAGVTLIDDYAHHPTEVAATLSAARDFGAPRIWAVFQPHLYSRTERFHREFGEALAAADVAVVTDVYGAREDPVPGVTGALIAKAIDDHQGTSHYVAHKADLAEFLAGRVQPGDLVLTMGAGDITLLPTELASILASE